LLSLLLEALTCPDEGVQLSTLSCLDPVLINPPQVLIQQLEALVNRLLALVSSPAMVSPSHRPLCTTHSETTFISTRRFSFRIEVKLDLQIYKDYARTWSTCLFGLFLHRKYALLQFDVFLLSPVSLHTR
ncbi:hypothetical protein XENOCAPTIV_000146, partial [Xenoophorus captivus]